MKRWYHLWHRLFGHRWHCMYDLGTCLEYHCKCGHTWTGPRKPDWFDMWKRARWHG